MGHSPEIASIKKVTDRSRCHHEARDITLLPLDKELTLVIACDSCGGVGDKPGDVVQAPPEITGYYTCRVAAMEVLAVGAAIRLVVDTLSVEWEPTGRRILAGIHQCLEEAGLDRGIALNGSTEENFVMTQTAMGITVIGYVPQKALLSGVSEEGDWVVSIGVPKVGGEIKFPVDQEVVSMKDFITLRRTLGVKDILPVGSRGLAYEGELLAQLNSLQVAWDQPPAFDMKKSAGPATCALAAMNRKAFESLSASLVCPLTPLGTLVKVTGR